MRVADWPRLSFTQTNACDVSGCVVVNGWRTQANENGSSKWCHLTVEWGTAERFLIRTYFYFSSCARQRQSHPKETFCVVSHHRTMLFSFIWVFSLYRNCIKENEQKRYAFAFLFFFWSFYFRRAIAIQTDLPMRNWQELVCFLLCSFFSCNLIREIWYEFEYLFIYIFSNLFFLRHSLSKTRKIVDGARIRWGTWLCPNCATACVFIRCDLTNGELGIQMRVNLFNRWHSNNNTNNNSNESTRNENKKSKRKFPLESSVCF